MGDTYAKVKTLFLVCKAKAVLSFDNGSIKITNTWGNGPRLSCF